MVHLRYRITPQTNLRAAFTTTLARPNFFDLVPFRAAGRRGPRAGQSRPGGDDFAQLRPAAGALRLADRRAVRRRVLQAAQRSDLPLHRGQRPGRRHQPAAQRRVGRDLRPRGRGAAAASACCRAPLRWARHLRQLHLHRLRGHAARRPGSAAAGQATHVFNTALSYEKGGFSGQVSLNYNDPFVLEFGGDVGARRSGSRTSSSTATCSSTSPAPTASRRRPACSSSW